MLNMTAIKYRKEPEKRVKMQHFDEKNSVVNRRAEKLYEYYICDFCGSEIRLDKKQADRSGGLAVLPNSLTRCGNITVALCNKCIKEVIKQLEK